MFKLSGQYVRYSYLRNWKSADAAENVLYSCTIDNCKLTGIDSF